MTMESMNLEQFRRFQKKTGVQNPRKASAVRSDDQTANVCQQAISTVCDLQSNLQTGLFRGNIKITVDINAKTQADIDNILKSVLDGLQGAAYINDKQVKEATVRICDRNY